MTRFIALSFLLFAGCGQMSPPTQGEPTPTTISRNDEMDGVDKLESSLATDVSTVVTIAQLKYRTYYETCIKAYGNNDSFAAEVLILVNNGPEPIPEKHRLWRSDSLWETNRNLRPTQFELDPAPAFPPLVETHPSGIKLTVHPFVWNACEFHFTSEHSSWEAVDRWHALWIDEYDKKSKDNHGLAGVIHWLREPIRNGNRVNLLVDFGSAPTDAFDGMIVALAQSGVAEVTVGSFNYE